MMTLVSACYRDEILCWPWPEKYEFRILRDRLDNGKFIYGQHHLLWPLGLKHSVSFAKHSFPLTNLYDQESGQKENTDPNGFIFQLNGILMFLSVKKVNKMD